MTQESRPICDPTRRAALAGIGLAGLAATLTACGGSSGSAASSGPAGSGWVQPGRGGSGCRAGGRRQRARGGQRGAGRRRQDLHLGPGRRDPAVGGRVPGVQRGLHPRSVLRRSGRERHDRLPVPRQQVQRQGRQRGRRARPPARCPASRSRSAPARSRWPDLPPRRPRTRPHLPGHSNQALSSSRPTPGRPPGDPTGPVMMIITVVLIAGPTVRTGLGPNADSAG